MNKLGRGKDGLRENIKVGTRRWKDMSEVGRKRTKIMTE